MDITASHPAAATARCMIRGLAVRRAALAPDDPRRRLITRRIIAVLMGWKMGFASVGGPTPQPR